MNLKIKLSPLAEQDLIDIWYYISLDNQEMAIDFVEKLRQRILTLTDFPLSGTKREDIKKGLRLLIFKKYNIFYSVKTDFIFIVRVLQKSRKIKNLL